VAARYGPQVLGEHVNPVSAAAGAVCQGDGEKRKICEESHGKSLPFGKMVEAMPDPDYRGDSENRKRAIKNQVQINLITPTVPATSPT